MPDSDKFGDEFGRQVATLKICVDNYPRTNKWLIILTQHTHTHQSSITTMPFWDITELEPNSRRSIALTIVNCLADTALVLIYNNSKSS